MNDGAYSKANQVQYEGAACSLLIGCVRCLLSARRCQLTRALDFHYHIPTTPTVQHNLPVLAALQKLCQFLGQIADDALDPWCHDALDCPVTLTAV